MSDPNLQQTAPGGHYSGSNKIPTIKEFMDKLDPGKSDRDRAADEKRAAAAAAVAKKSPKHATSGDATPHVQEPQTPSKAQPTVTDPTTGKQIVVENVGPEMMERAKNPQLSVPNANLGRDTPVKTDPHQPYDEYKHNQDVTAPPDPVAEGSTSDVPIHGEKTNILFHPTPSVSYEPTFAMLERRANIMCIAIFLATVIVGNMFGGALKGLIPLAMCLASGVWLWVKEVVRSGREVEWSSEKSRGETVSTH